MSPRRSDDDEGENWQHKRASDIERLFKWAMSIIGLLILLICGFAWNTLIEVRDLNLKTNALATGNARIIEDHLNKTVEWTKEEKDEYKAIKQEAYRRWGYFLNTRSGEEVLLKQPMKEIP